MRFLGGKSRIAKRLAHVMPDSSEVNNVFEPFCGGGAVTVELAKRYPRVQASDTHEELITMWQMLQKGWSPPQEVSEETYQFWKSAQPTTPEEAALKAFIGYGCSFGGKWFGGYARGGVSASGTQRDHTAESFQSVHRAVPHLGGVTFVPGDYVAATKNAQPGDLVYCDPPYAGTTKYNAVNTFDNERFWDWALELSRSGVQVFVSEYNAPTGWKAVWEREMPVHVSGGSNRQKAVEKLFTYAAE